MASLDIFKNSALPFTLIIEGGYSDDKNDHGGKTYRGITTAEYLTYREHCGLPAQPVINMTDDEMHDIYLKDYWMAGHCPTLPDMTAIACFDSCVNNGVSRASMFLQKAVGVTVDGIVGPVTLKAIAATPEQTLLSNYMTARKNFYDAIVAHDPTQKVFYAGWIRRLTMLTAFTTGKKTLAQVKAEW
jgi:lysozyme family protein